MSLFNLYTVHVNIASTKDTSMSMGLIDRLFEVHATNNSDAIGVAHAWINEHQPDWRILATPFVYLVRELDEDDDDTPTLRTLRVDYHGDSKWTRPVEEGQRVISVKLHRLTTWQEVKDTLVDMHDVSEEAVVTYIDEMAGPPSLEEEVLEPEDLEFELGYDIETDFGFDVYVAVNWNAERLNIADCRADAYEWIDEQQGIKECFLIVAHKPAPQTCVLNVIEPRREC